MAEADYISIHLRLSDTTSGLMDRTMLMSMKPSAFLVNTSRASLVDEDVLWELLKEKKIAGAGLDVFGEEPLPNPHRWQDLSNVVLTPHTAWRTKETIDRFVDRAVKNALTADAETSGRSQSLG